MSFAETAVAAMKADKWNLTCLPCEFKPSLELQVRFDSGDEVQYGNILKKSRTATAPSFAIPGADPNQVYSIVCVDVDAPNRGFMDFLGPIAHMIQQDVRVDAYSVVKAPPAMVPYIGPAPPMGLHRYVFLLYRNKSERGILPFVQQTTIKSASMGARMRFNVPKFVNDNSLELVGINWFQANSSK